MAYLNIADFKFGMDRRRPRVAGIPGTLWTLKNAFISRGGDVVRAKKFVPTYDLPAGTFGQAALKSQPYVFGSIAAPTMPFGVQYQQLASPYAANMVRLIDAKPVDGKMYAIAQYDDGNVHHFYDGTRITDWDSITASSFAYVAEQLALKISANAAVTAVAVGADIKITAKVPGTTFICTATAVDTDGDLSAPTAAQSNVTANVVAVPVVRASATVTVTGGSAGAANYITQVATPTGNLLAAHVPWVTSNTATAAALVVAINNRTATTFYTASRVGAVVTITRTAGAGTFANGFVLTVTKSGTVATSKTNFAGGVDAVAAVAQVDKVAIGGGVYDGTDTWYVVVNGTTYLGTGLSGDAGTSIFVHKHRVWSTAKSLLRYCKLNTFTDWTTTAVPATDSGFLNLAAESEGSQDLIGCARYNGFAAIFAADSVTIYSLSTDAEDNAVQQTLDNTGSSAAKSIVGYGNTDVFYLEATGIRSIRSRDGYNAGFVSDVGSAIDSFVQDLAAEVGPEVTSRAEAIIDTNEGRYMLAIGDTIIALSYFPSSKITAWSFIEPGFDIDNLTRAGRQILARSGDTIYLYGGADGTEYPDADEQVVNVYTPFMSANDPAGIKMLTGVDIACTNDWHMEILVDPNDETLLVDAGTLNGVSYNREPAIHIPGETSHIAFNMTCSAAGNATLSSLAIHFEKLVAA